MALFGGGDYGEAAMPRSLGAKECKPDYEAMILNEKLKKEAAATLMRAIEHYLEVNSIGPYSRDSGLLQASFLLGNLYLEIKDHDELIAELIKRQEEDK